MMHSIILGFMRFLYQNQKNPCLLPPLSMQRKGSWSDWVARRNTQMRKVPEPLAFCSLFPRIGLRVLQLFLSLYFLVRHNRRTMKCLDSRRSSEGSTGCYLACIGAYHPLGFTAFFRMILYPPWPARSWVSTFFLCLWLFSLNQIVFWMSTNILNSIKWLDLFFYLSFHLMLKLLFTRFLQYPHFVCKR